VYRGCLVGEADRGCLLGSTELARLDPPAAAALPKLLREIERPLSQEGLQVGAGSTHGGISPAFPFRPLNSSYGHQRGEHCATTVDSA